MNEELKIIISAEISKLKKQVNDAKKTIGGLDKDSQKTAEAVNKTFEKMGEGISKAFKTAAKASAVVVTAIGGITTAAVKGYADYEQLKGGVEKLFGDSSKVILQYAQDAYKTAGLSANEYMETVTGFSAGLIASMGGDTAAAAEIANMAINDMADNASVFGTSIEDIQNAYQGFAKGNFTMLDNLKLGYGGTREEMQRLLDDAERISGIHYDINSLDDLYSAIHVVQEEMDITGNSAEEAGDSISGSINSAKKAWDDLITGMGDDEADIPQLTQNAVDESCNAIHNITPVVQEVLDNIPVAISEISPEAGEAFQTIVDVASPIFDTLKEVALDVFIGIGDALGFIQEHSTVFEVLAVGVGILVGAIALYNTVQSISAGIQAAKIALNLTESATLWSVAAAAFAALAPYLLIVAAIAAVIAIIVVCIKHWDEIKAKVTEVWTSIKEKTHEAVEAVKEKFNNLKERITGTVEEIKQKVVDKFNHIKEGIKQKIQEAKEAVVEKFNAIKTAITEKVQGAKDAVVNKFTEIKTSITEKVEAVKAKVKETFEKVKTAITEPVEKAKGKVKELIEKIKGFFKFEWKLPHLKMPHIKITGEFSLLPPKAPHFSIDWHEMGGVFDSTHLFGYGGGIHGLGENGAEAIVPLEKNTKWLDRLATMLAQKQGSGQPIVLQVDGKTFAQISCDSINDLTRQTGSLPLVIA